MDPSSARQGPPIQCVTAPVVARAALLGARPFVLRGTPSPTPALAPSPARARPCTRQRTAFDRPEGRSLRFFVLQQNPSALVPRSPLRVRESLTHGCSTASCLRSTWTRRRARSSRNRPDDSGPRGREPEARTRCQRARFVTTNNKIKNTKTNRRKIATHDAQAFTIGERWPLFDLANMVLLRTKWIGRHSSEDSLCAHGHCRFALQRTYSHIFGFDFCSVTTRRNFLNLEYFHSEELRDFDTKE